MTATHKSARADSREPGNVRLASTRDKASKSDLKKLASQFDKLGETGYKEQAEITKDVVALGTELLPQLFGALDCDDGVRIAAITEIIVKIGPEAIPRLVDLITHENQFVQGAAIEILVRLGEPSAMPMLQLLQSDSQLATGNAREVIRRIGKKAFVALRVAANPDHPAHSLEGINLLIEIDPEAHVHLLDQLSNSLASPDQHESSMATKAFEKIGEPATIKLVKMMEEANPYAQQNSTNTLINMGETAVPVLIDALGSVSQLAQQNAVRALLQIGKPAIPALLEASKNDVPVVRDYASQILGKIGAKKRGFFSRA